MLVAVQRGGAKYYGGKHRVYLCALLFFHFRMITPFLLCVVPVRPSPTVATALWGSHSTAKNHPIMKMPKRKDTVSRNAARLQAVTIRAPGRLHSFQICLMLAAISLTATAQDNNATPPPQQQAVPLPAPPAPLYGTGVISPPAAAPGTPIESTPFQWGPVNVRPHLLYRFLYGDGVQSAPGQPRTTAINS